MKRSLLLRDEDESFHLRIRRRWGSVKVVTIGRSRGVFSACSHEVCRR